MGLFGKKEEKVRAEISFEQLTALREYMERHLKADRNESEQSASEPTQRESVKYSLMDPGYDEDGITDIHKYMASAKKDSALLNHPAIQKAYHQWEKETAVHRTFSSEVLQILDNRKAKHADFYKGIQLDKRVFSCMKKDFMYKPSRDTAIRCCVGLKLSYEEASELLKLAGYALSPGDSRDLVLRYCLENEIWDIDLINGLLGAWGEKEIR